MFTKFFKLIVKTFYREIKVKGLENLSGYDRAIFTPNHPNALIDPLLLSFLPSSFQIHFIAKAPLFKFPLLGWLMHRIGAIPVVRKFEADGEVDYNAFFESCLDALASGGSLAIFPEGMSLPQPRLSGMKTGAARLFFMAHERYIYCPVIPVGLNYEQGSIFRSSVVIWITRPIETSDLVRKYKHSPYDSVRQLTERIAEALRECVFQSENFIDRNLMLSLVKIYSGNEGSISWPERLERLKQFENGLNTLQDCCPTEINFLRQMVSRYKILENSIENLCIPFNRVPNSPKHFFIALVGFPFAAIGYLVAFLPYQLCSLTVKYLKKYDEASAATFKVIYSIFLYPVTFLIETVLIYILFGGVASILFAILIIPLCYFTIHFREWLYEEGWGIPLNLVNLRKSIRNRISRQLEELGTQIRDTIDDLADRMNRQTENKTEQRADSYE